MKCPKCGYDKIQPNYKFCPKCRTALTQDNPAKSTPKISDDKPEIRIRHAEDDGNGNTSNAFSGVRQTISDQVSPRIAQEYGTDSLEFVKNKAIWKIEKGEVARHITPREIDCLDNLDGVIVEDGVTAIIEVDGEVVAELSGGIYNFATDKTVEEAKKKIDEEEKDKGDGQGVFGHLRKAARVIGRFLLGNKDSEAEKEKQEKESHYRHVLRRITDKSVVSVYLKANRPFTSLFGIKNIEGADGAKQIEFEPYQVRTRVLDVQIGVSLQLAVVNFNDFITNYMTGIRSVTISDISFSVSPFLRSLLQNSLRTVEIDGNVLSEEQLSNLSYKIKNLEAMLPGISIVNVLEITLDNSDLDRFRAVERELYEAERELDYLNRTNEFKNRLAETQYLQQISEASNELDHVKLLDEVNKDGLIHEDEMEAFVQLLNSQKRIREAKTDAEEEKALLELRGNRLVNQDDYASLEDSLKNKQFERSQVAEVLRIKSLANTAKLRQQADAELTMQTLRSEIDLDRAKRDYRDETDISDAEKEKTLLGKKIEAQSMVDDYASRVAERDYDLEKRRTLDAFDLEKQKQLSEMDLLRQKAELARENMAAMKEQSRKDKELDYAHEDKAGEREIEKERIRAAMSAEQIAAVALKDLDVAAQAEYMKARGSDNENEVLKQSSAEKEAMLREMMKMQQESADKSSATQMAMMQQMLDFAKTANATTASIAGGVTASKAQSEKELRESMERVATKRIGEVDDMKKEYQDELHKEQKRTDTAQDKALNYTTKITLAESKSAVKSDGSSKSLLFVVEDLGGKSVSLETIATYIANGVVVPLTQISVDGSTMAAMDIDEIYPLLVKYCSAKCPACGTSGLIGTCCPECGAEID